MHTLPSLPFEYTALEPHIDAQTMEIHHTKHHQAYIDKLNAALETHEGLQALSVEELLGKLSSLPEEIKMAIRNHGGGHANHSLFWSILGVGTTEAQAPSLSAKLTETFGSIEKFKEAFASAAAGQFGSGWAWLVLKTDASLAVSSTPNQDSPLLQAEQPIIGLDVWEHAYYLKYQNKRPDYIQAFWQVLDWSQVEARYVAMVQ
ncbi:MAG: superoxide dismutase [Candidatus Pacebacteria bacterium]|nr:superoxide dismutase [Candidatus Paceibacterota bacterium]PIR59916.1 MAG: superoxide dismutase [Candidatus Pacebacteria bacterium CG10_big_fil_rev_8_21_14_0_10_44_54]